MGPPGIFLVKSKITKDGFKPEDFTKWYNETHVPDIIASSVQSPNHPLPVPRISHTHRASQPPSATRASTPQPTDRT